MIDNTRRKLGRSDLLVSPVAMGCWPISGMTSLNVVESESRKTLQAALDSGINFFDTAHCYGIDGISEILVGQMVPANMESMVVATKCGVHWSSNASKITDGSRRRLMFECEQSLRRLKRDQIDLMYLHEPDPKIQISESAEIFQEMIASGKVRYAGLSNVSVEQAQAFHEVCPIVAIQPPFNLMQQQIRSELVPWCEANHVAIVCYWPLMKGLLAGRIRRDFTFDTDDKRRSYEIFQGQQFEQAQQILDQLDEFGRSTGLTVAQLVIAWTISQSFVTSALCGAKREWQIRETAAAMNNQLPSSVLSAIGDLV